MTFWVVAVIGFLFCWGQSREEARERRETEE